MHNLRLKTAVLVLSIALSFVMFRIVSAQNQIPSEDQKQKNIACLSNERQISVAVLMYSQDYDEVMPPMKSAATVQKVTFPYTKNKQLYTCPETKLGYVFNPALNRVHMASILKPPTTPLLCDAKAHVDGSWMVGFADGHCKSNKKRPAEFSGSGKMPSSKTKSKK